MKRSEINQILQDGMAFFEAHQFLLPPFGHWSPEDWKHKGPECRRIIAENLGWDITDFGSGDFACCGLLLFTVRNGVLSEAAQGRGKPYGEKIMIVREGQVTPAHHHLQKIEDIINRGGGELIIRLWNLTEAGDAANTSVTINKDGVDVTVSSGETIVLKPGESVCLPQRLRHEFWGSPGKGQVLVGEVSSINDDHTDNIFASPVGRFPEIAEDEPPVRLLCGDYGRYYRS